MSVVNYRFGMEHEVALYQITVGGGAGTGLVPAGTSAGLGGVVVTVSSFSETWTACYKILLRRMKLISCPLKGARSIIRLSGYCPVHQGGQSLLLRWDNRSEGLGVGE